MPDPTPVPAPTPPTPKTMGDLLTNLQAAETTSEASKAAAVAANQQAVDDADFYATQQELVAAALKITGPITLPNGDDTFTTFDVSTTAPYFSKEVSHATDFPLPVTPTPSPTPTPGPTPPPVAS